jgi:hypothetical protein
MGLLKTAIGRRRLAILQSLNRQKRSPKTTLKIASDASCTTDTALIHLRFLLDRGWIVRKGKSLWALADGVEILNVLASALEGDV